MTRRLTIFFDGIDRRVDSRDAQFQSAFAHFQILTAAYVAPLVALQVTQLLSRTARIFPWLG